MLKFGQAVKLTKEARVQISGETATAWGKKYHLIEGKNLYGSRYAQRDVKSYIMLIPAGTLGVLCRYYLDGKTEQFGIRIPHPKTGKPSKFTVYVYGKDVTPYITKTDKEEMAYMQRVLVMRVKSNNFDKVKKLREATQETLDYLR